MNDIKEGWKVSFYFFFIMNDIFEEIKYIYGVTGGFIDNAVMPWFAELGFLDVSFDFGMCTLLWKLDPMKTSGWTPQLNISDDVPRRWLIRPFFSLNKCSFSFVVSVSRENISREEGWNLWEITKKNFYITSTVLTSFSSFLKKSQSLLIFRWFMICNHFLILHRSDSHLHSYGHVLLVSTFFFAEYRSNN